MKKLGVVIGIVFLGALPVPAAAQVGYLTQDDYYQISQLAPQTRYTIELGGSPVTKAVKS